MSGLDAVDPLLAPYTEGDTMLVLPFTESEAIAAKMTDRTFIKYSFGKDIQPSEIKITKLYNQVDLQFETNFSNIEIKNNLK